ncbi:hypothetical protein TNCV_2630221 [Trichonephila clavipes]|uniref:Uncharacterized protein n=1 Tax=Trichonephila clavipes TaxID=2585209 RepID=A0A8X6SFB1_TRICX|nr:hypothetical protein TNCV_2630221 [Trichonephila clavipes]
MCCVVLLLIPPDRQRRNQGPQNSSCKGLSDACRSFEHHTGDRTILTHSNPNFEGEHPGNGQGPPDSLPLPPTSREDLRLDGYLKNPHAAKVHLQASMSSLGFERSPNGTAVSVVNHSTG